MLPVERTLSMLEWCISVVWLLSFAGRSGKPDCPPAAEAADPAGYSIELPDMQDLPTKRRHSLQLYNILC